MANAPKPIRVGLVGANVNHGWGSLSHVPAIKALPGNVELTAVCTAHRETAEDAARAFGARLAFWDYRELVVSPEIDVVAISVKVAHHKEIALAAIAAGKHIYCEWPVGVNEAEAREITAAAKAKGIHTIAGLQGRVAPWVQYVRELLAEGYFGRMLQINARFFGPNSGMLAGNRASARRDAGSHIMAIRGIHLTDMICGLFGEFEELSARSGTQFTPWVLKDGSTVDVDAPDYFSLAGTVRSGAFASLHFAYTVGFTSGWAMEAYGEKATLYTRSPDSGHRELNTVTIGKVSDKAMQELVVPDRFFRIRPEEARGSAFNVAHNYAMLAQSIREGRTIGMDFEASLARYEMIRAAEESASRGGCSVRVGG